MACEICKKSYVLSTKDNSDEKPHVCNVCGKSFSCKLPLKRHMIPREGDRPCICTVCEKHLDESSSYNLRFSKKSNFSCETCNKSFSTHRSLLRHANEHTVESSLICDDCGDFFRSVSALKKHCAIHKSKKRERKEMPYVCQVCGKGFSEPQPLEEHYLQHKKFRCTSCDICFASNKLLEEHLQYCGCSTKEKDVSNIPADASNKDLNLCNAEDKKHVCDICGKSFTRKSSLEGHVISHYVENRESAVEDDSDKDADFQCNYKDDKLGDPSKRLCLPKLKIRRSFSCEQCGFVCSTKKLLDKHKLLHRTNQKSLEKKIVETKKTYVCRVCNEPFNSKENYKKHKVCHDRKELEKLKEKEQKTYTCQICLKEFSRKKHLKKHVVTHIEDRESSSLSSGDFHAGKKLKRIKNFACSFCGKRFAGETCLKKHESRHIDDDKEDPLSTKSRKGKKPKPLVCEFCNEDFTGRRHHYLKHKLSHTPEVCGICDKRFTDRASLREHCRIHIGTEEGRRFLECSQKALDAKNGLLPPEPKVEYIYLVLR